MKAAKPDLLSVMALFIAISFNTGVVAQSNRAQLKVVEHHWGFDGRVQPGQFNPLSILLDNQTKDPIDAVITLQRVSNRLTAQGGQYTQQIYIEPAGRRWVPFYPYIPQSYQTEWHLTINDGDKYKNEPVGSAFTQARAVTQKDSPQDQLRPQVIILDADNNTTRPSTVKHMPENIFPAYATATVGLHTVFLDHVPDWELPRQQAFLSWLKLGGRLHLLQNSRGEFPRFSGELGDINQPLNRYTVGNGIVVRHPIRRNALTESIVQNAIIIDVLKGKDTEAEKEIREQFDRTQVGVRDLIPIDPATTDDTIFEGLRKLTHPDHAWWLIFLLALCYIGLIFPGCFLISKQKQRDFLATYGAIVGLAAVFSVLFLIIGQRGYGESTTLQTVAIARSEDATHWNVFQWNAFFVTSGDNYTASAPDQQILMSIADTGSNEDAQVSPGNGGQAHMRIPPYSSQAFVSRRRVAADDWKLAMSEADVQISSLVSLKIDVGENFPVSEDAQYLVLSKRSLYEMRYNAEEKQLQLFGARRRLATYCQPRYGHDFSNPWFIEEDEEPETRSEEQIFFDNTLPSLVQRSLMDDLVETAANFELPPDRVRLFVYAPLPKNFDLTVSAEANRYGRILYVKDLFLRNDRAN